MGMAMIFIRRDNWVFPNIKAGHVGWAFEMANGAYCCGSTENVTGNSSGSGPGFDNKAWYKVFSSRDEMLQEMRTNHFGHPNRYDEYKQVRITQSNPQAALEEAKANLKKGYNFPGNTCLDHACDVLENYGVPWQNGEGKPDWGMPWKQTHLHPNHWFDDWKADGEVYSL